MGGQSDPSDIELAPGRERRRVVVTNNSIHSVRISSHYPFDAVNHRLAFDREVARGFRLDIPSGSSIRWEPDETREVTLVAFGGALGVDP